MNTIFGRLWQIFIQPIIEGLLVKEVRGLENIPKGPFILVSNHSSYLDIIIDGHICLPRKFHFVGQIDGWIGLMRWLIRIFYFFSGVIPLDRNSRASRQRALRLAIKALKRGDILVLYPEGKRSRSGLLQKGKFGTAKIFLKTGVPVLPVGLKGPFEILPPKGKFKIKKIIEVNIGTPIFFDEELKLSQGLHEESLEYRLLLEKITDKIMKEISRLVNL